MAASPPNRMSIEENMCALLSSRPSLNAWCEL
jgi:hypothetical protein